MRGRRALVKTKPCEFCGAVLTKTSKEQGQRKYWTCNRSCANKLRIQNGNTPDWATNPLRGQKETRPCVECGTPVTRYLSQRTQAQIWACSGHCRGVYQTRRKMAEGTWKRPEKKRRGEAVPCATCGKPTYRQKSMLAKAQSVFCSPECHNAAQRLEPVIKRCALPSCGKEMRLKPSQAARQHCCRAHETLGRIVRQTGETHNGRPVKTDRAGYRMVWEPEHPNKSMKGWQYEHRLIMERKIGRYLRPDEHVDHINDVKGDNRPENLQVLSPSQHSAKTGADKRRKKAEIQAELDAYRARYGPLKE